MKKGMQSFQFHHALYMYDAADQLVNGTATPQDQSGACRLAQSVLRLMPEVSYVLLHRMDDTGRVWPQPVERVDWDQEWATNTR